jgi:hypothetical protein
MAGQKDELLVLRPCRQCIWLRGFATQYFAAADPCPLGGHREQAEDGEIVHLHRYAHRVFDLGVGTSRRPRWGPERPRRRLCSGTQVTSEETGTCASWRPRSLMSARASAQTRLALVDRLSPGQRRSDRRPEAVKSTIKSRWSCCVGPKMEKPQGVAPGLTRPHIRR